MAPWKIASVLAVLASLCVGAGWIILRADPSGGGVAVLGDEAPALHSAMGTQQALPLHTASITVVSVQGWGRLRYIPDMANLCGEACYGDPGLVRVVPLSPTGSRKVVFVNLEAWPGTAGLTRATEEKDFACVAQTLRAEFRSVRSAAVPECATDVPMQTGTRWVLPAGLGAI
ncbi:MAG: hypothetical protein AAGB05_12445 [Pseudomonadota bacterium]